MDQAWAALGGAFLGASAGITGGLMLEAYKRYRDRQGTAMAFAGSIQAIIKTTERRNYVQYFTAMAAAIESGHPARIGKLVDDRDRIDPIADSYIDRLGSLGPKLAGRVVEFYSYQTGIRLDILRLADGEFQNDPNSAVMIIREDLSLWADTERLGRELIVELTDTAQPLAVCVARMLGSAYQRLTQRAGRLVSRWFNRPHTP
jgi:hypothetical protein